jgi:hypothetical protein
MLHDLFGGFAYRATAGGIRAAMANYGFDAVEIYAGVATGTPTAKPSERVKNMLAANEKYRDQLVTKGVTVLEGYLRETRESVDEKKVDVLLALQVADITDRVRRGESNAECIVMLSEDMDLQPAYVYAAERGLPVYALANDVIHTREDQHKWLLLHEQTGRLLGEIDDREGSPTRANIARTALGVNRPMFPTKWRAQWQQHAGDVTLVNNRGVRGHWYSTCALVAGERLDLHVTGITFEDSGDIYPRVQLSQTPPPPGPLKGVSEATVTAWVSPTKVKATISGGGDCTLTIPPGSVLIGDKIAVLAAPSKGGHAHYFIGPVASWKAPSGWTHGRPVTTVAITNTPAGPHWDAVAADGTPMLVHNHWLRHAATGDTLLVALTGADASGRLYAMPLSCCLP